MDDQFRILTEAGINLTSLAVKGTVSAVTTKIKALKTEKDLETLRNKYDELINELLSEREEAIRIAQVYKNEVDRLVISDKDIDHLNRTIDRILKIFQLNNPNSDFESYTQFRELLNVDTLKAMQLLGFNYRAAIGEPLTILCSEAILSLSKNRNSAGRQNTSKKK